MELTNKEIRKVHSMAKATYKKIMEIQDFLEPYENAGFNMRVYPSVFITTTNIFKVQDVIGGDLVQKEFLLKNKYFDVTLEVDGVRYIQSGLTQEDINARQSNLDYTF